MRLLFAEVLLLSLVIVGDSFGAVRGGTRGAAGRSGANRTSGSTRPTADSRPSRRAPSPGEVRVRPAAPAASPAARPGASRHPSRPAASRALDENACNLLRERIANDLFNEILQNPGSPPDRGRLEAIARRQFQQAQAEGLIPADVEFDPSADLLEGTHGIGTAGSSLFDGAAGPSRGGSTRRRSDVHVPRRDSMYLPSRSNMYVPRRSSIAGQSPRSGGLSSGGAPAQLPGLTGANGGNVSPEELNRQLQQLLK